MGIIVRQGIKNNIITYVGVIIGFANILVVQPLVLKEDELGLLRLLFSVATLFASIFPLGLNMFTVKYFPYFKDQKSGHHGYLGFLVGLSTIFFILGSILFYLFKPYFISKYSESALFIEQFNYIFPLSYFLGLFTVITAYSSSIFKTTFPSFLNEIVTRIIIISAVGLYFVKLISFETLIFIYVSAYALIIILMFIYFKRTDSINFNFTLSIFKKIDLKAAIKFTLIMCFTALASISLRNIDVVFIGSYLKLGDVAVYTIAITICSMIDVPGSALSKIIIPKIAEAFKNDNLAFIKELYLKSTRVTLISGSFLFLIVFVNAHEILSFLPQKYAEGEWVIKIIAIGGLINMATGLNINIIQYSPNYMVGTIAFIALALLSALSNNLLIPLYGIEGAAIGTSCSIILVNVFTVLYIYVKYKMQPFTAIDAGILLSALSLATLDHYLPKIDNEFLSIFTKSTFITILFVVPVLKLNLIPELNTLIKAGKEKLSK